MIGRACKPIARLKLFACQADCSRGTGPTARHVASSRQFGRSWRCHGRTNRHRTPTRRPSPKGARAKQATLEPVAKPRGDHRRRRCPGHDAGPAAGPGPPAAAEPSEERIASRPQQQRRVLLLGGARLVPEAFRRHRHRCLSAVWQPPQELYRAERHACGPRVVRLDRYAAHLSRSAARRDRHKHLHGGDQHGGRRLYGGNRAGRFRLGPVDRDPPVRATGLPDRERPCCRLSRQRRLRLDRLGVRRDHVPAGARDHTLSAGAASATGLRGGSWAMPTPNS